MVNTETESMKHYLSLGAGVQSSTLALLAARGIVEPMPEAAIFADTQDEPASVYRWLDWLEKQLPFPVVRVSKGRLADKALKMRTTKDGRKFSLTNIPVFTLSADGQHSKVPHRSCTADFKIKPIVQAIRKLATVKRGTKKPVAVQWIGISTDEVRRIKPSREPWLVSRWPLVEIRWNRQRCLSWLNDNGYPTPPRSACVYCPFQRNDEWRRLKNEEPHEFAKAVEFERSLQDARSGATSFASTPYLHRSCKPLDQIDFRNDVDRGQLLLWDDECEGMCGV